MPHADILDERQSLRKPFGTSLAMHVLVAGTLLGAGWYQGRNKVAWGDIHGGGFGSVAVNVVSRIPLPTENGPVNPVASDTQSRVPEPPPKPQPKAAVKPPLKDLDSIPISGRTALKKAAQAASAQNKFRQAQKDLPNQVYSQAGQRLVAPDMVGMSGGGSVGLGNNSPFGTKFGAYADMIRNKVGLHWNTGGLRIKTGTVIVTFTIQRDGSVAQSSVKVRQTSGIEELDLSAQRAVLESVPFLPLPAGYSGSRADVEFWFELRR